MSLQSNAQTLYNGYISLGVPDAGARALSGVQAYENGGGALPNPGGDARGVFGISQWTPNANNMGRYNDAVSGITAISDTNSLHDLSAQQQYTLTEMQVNYPSSYDAVMNGDNPNAIASTLVNKYEGPLQELRPHEIAAAQGLASGIEAPITGGDFPANTPDPNLPNVTPGLGGLPHGDAGIGGDPTQSTTSPPEAFNPDTIKAPDLTPDKPTQGQDTGSGAPVVITDITSAGTKAGGDIQKGLDTAGGDVVKAGSGLDTTVNQATGSALSTGTGWLQSISNLVYDVIPRAGFGVLAIIMVAIGLWFIGKEQK